MTGILIARLPNGFHLNIPAAIHNKKSHTWIFLPGIGSAVGTHYNHGGPDKLDATIERAS